MSAVNGVLTALADLLLAPFAARPPLIALSVVALVTSTVILLVFRATSNQRELRRVKGRMVAGILEIRLFRDDPLSIFRSQAGIFRESLTYLRLSLVPLAWILLPMALLVAQLQSRFAYQTPQVGKRMLLRVQLENGFFPGQNGENLALEAPDGVRLDTPLLFLSGRNQAVWGISVVERGRHQLLVRTGNALVEKELTASEGILHRSPRRPSRSLVDQLLHPLEPAVPRDSPIRFVEVTYPDARIRLLGWETHWMVAFFAFTLGFTLLMQRPLRVTI